MEGVEEVQVVEEVDEVEEVQGVEGGERASLQRDQSLAKNRPGAAPGPRLRGGHQLSKLGHPGVLAKLRKPHSKLAN